MYKSCATLPAARGRLPLAVMLLGVGISQLPLFALALFTFPSADDFCYAVEARKEFWPMQLQYYLQWSGRYTATFLLSLLDRYDLSGVYPWFCAATLLATLFAFRVFVGAACARDTPSHRLWAAGGVATAVFVGGLPSLVEAFFWATSAATYQWAIIAYLVWVAMLIRIARDAGSGSGELGVKAVATVLTVLLPGFNEVLTPVILATLAGSVIVCRWYRQRTDRFMLALMGVAVLLVAVMILAPGNAIRGAVYPQIPTRHNVGFALAETARKTVRFLASYGSYMALWAAACATWWWGPRILPRAMKRTGAHAGIAAWIVAIPAGLYLTLFPLYWEYGAVNYTGEGRTYNITYFVFCITAALAAATLLAVVSDHFPRQSARLRASAPTVDLLLAGALAFLMVSSPGTRQAFKALKVAPEYLRAQQARESVLRAPSNRGKAVVVDTMRLKPRGLFWGDIQPEETHWINTCVATYYGLGSVRTR